MLSYFFFFAKGSLIANLALSSKGNRNNKVLEDSTRKISFSGKINQEALGSRGNGVKGQIVSQSTKRHSQIPKGQDFNPLLRLCVELSLEWKSF